MRRDFRLDRPSGSRARDVSGRHELERSKAVGIFITYQRKTRSLDFLVTLSFIVPTLDRVLDTEKIF